MSGACDTVVTVWALAVTGLVFLAIGYGLARSVTRWIKGG